MDERDVRTDPTGFHVDPRPVEGRPAVWRVSVRGELDATTSSRLDDVLRVAADQGARTILLDLTACSFLDSSGLRTIVTASDRCTAAGGGLGCVGLSAAAERVLEVVGLLERLRAVPVGSKDHPNG